MEKKPLVSILLLSMNHEEFIEQCIQSLINQNYKNIEILYLDNVSNDKTFEIGKSLLENSGITYQAFQNLESKGVSINLNFLIHHSSGGYLIPLSSDDWLTQNSIEEKLIFLKGHPEYGMVYSSCYYYDYEKKEAAICPNKNEYKHGWVLKDLLKENFIRSIGSMINRKTFQKVGFFDEGSLLEDWEMWIRIAESFRIGYIDKELGYYGRKSGKNITGNYKYMIEGADYIVEKYSHYKEIKYLRRKIIDTKCYNFATHEPSLKSLLFILKHYRFNWLFGKQLLKTILSITKLPYQPFVTAIK